ncbi:MAG: site-specific integrase [Fusobacteriaceae bacterium]|nr:site-specific integrase [Fusobacteriaceae bacterium]
MDKVDLYNIEKRWEETINTLNTGKHVKKNTNFKDPNKNLAFSYQYKNKKLILEFIRDMELGKTGKIKKFRMLKVLQSVMKFERDVKKEFKDLKEKEMEDYFEKYNKNHATSTTRNYLAMIYKLFEWLVDKGVAEKNYVEKIHFNPEEKEKQSLTRYEIERLVEACSGIRTKAFIMTLFDSGARIEEFLNIRINDVTPKEGYYMIRIKKGTTKTKSRTISVRLASPLLKLWIENHPEKDNPEALLFAHKYDDKRAVTYDAVNKTLKRLGEKVLKKKISPHTLRHSSATYYATIIKEYGKFCYRYGWRMGSPMAEYYLDKTGKYDEGVADSVEGDEISKYKHSLERLQEKNSRREEEFVSLRTEMSKLQQSNMVFQKAIVKVLKGFADKDKVDKAVELLEQEGMIEALKR